MKTQIISVVNQKGGVGKTTTAINLASYLSELNQRVLLVDMDAQANATSGIGLNADSIQENVYDVLLNLDSIKKALYPTPFDNLHVLPSTRDLSGAEVEIVAAVSRETLLKRALDQVRGLYDFIIIDCPPSLGMLTLNALVASDGAVVPVQCEYFALEGIASLVNTLSLIKETFNPDFEILGIVLTMFDGRTTLNNQVVENTRRFFNKLVFDTVIPRNIRLSESPSHGLPIALYSPDSKGAEAYYNLAREVVLRV